MQGENSNGLGNLPKKINPPSNGWLEKEAPDRVTDVIDASQTGQVVIPRDDHGRALSAAPGSGDASCLPPEEPGDTATPESDDMESEPVESAKKSTKGRAGTKKKAKGKKKTKAKGAKRPKTQAKAMPGEAEAKEINDDHDEFTEELSSVAEEMASRSKKIGQKLIQIKKAVGHGHWQQWVEKYLTFSIATAKRYMASTKPKRSNVSVLKDCATSMDAGRPGETTDRKAPSFKFFTPAATKVLNLPVEDISPEYKMTILAEYKRLEPIAHKLSDQPSIFTLSVQKKLKEPPVRWARNEVALLKAEIEKAQAFLAEYEKDALFDAEPAALTAQEENPVPVEGDAP